MVAEVGARHDHPGGQRVSQDRASRRACRGDRGRAAIATATACSTSWCPRSTLAGLLVYEVNLGGVDNLQSRAPAGVRSRRPARHLAAARRRRPVGVLRRGDQSPQPQERRGVRGAIGIRPGVRPPAESSKSAISRYRDCPPSGSASGSSGPGARAAGNAGILLGSPMSRPASARLTSIDALRGLVMIIMALDHMRDFFHARCHGVQPDDLAHTTPALFFTRWITHFCAPVFFFLRRRRRVPVGSRAKARTRPRCRAICWTRGLWLIVLELTVMRFGFFLSLHRGPAAADRAVGAGPAR